MSQKPQNYNNQREQSHIHPLSTVGDNIVLENLRDVIQDFGNEKNIETDIKSYVYGKLLIGEDKKQQHRINNLMREIEKQDGIQIVPPSNDKMTRFPNDGVKLTKDDFDPLTPADYIKNQNDLMKSQEYQTIKKEYEDKMKPLLENKKLIDLEHQCADEEFCANMRKEDLFKPHNVKLKHGCEPMQRIECVLKVYHELLIQDKLWKKVAMGPMIISDEYGHQQLHNDFLHVKLYHIDADNKKLLRKENNMDNEDDEKKSDGEKPQGLAQFICEKFSKLYLCKDVEKCDAFKRHYRDRTDRNKEKELFHVIEDTSSKKGHEIRNDKEQIIQEECDKIHSSTIRFTLDDEEKANELIDDIANTADGRSYSKGQENDKNKNESDKKQDTNNSDSTGHKAYVGKKEDESWLQKFANGEAGEGKEDGYRLLVQHMGVFRWQSAHGFRTGQNRGLQHLKPKFKNVKEEALQNTYSPASKDNWNQTLRKSKIFLDSFARAKIRTPYQGSFTDDVTDRYQQWKQYDEVTLQEIVMLKLYTDFDKLQHELKKCFRWETIVAVLDKLNEDKNKNNKDKRLIAKLKKENEEQDKQHRSDLENRLREFFHWRVGLLIVLNKFGKKIKEESMVLYHGVNAKMILNPAETMAFYGPLSTTSSYHVAKTFATAKGMVLKITSQYPRLDYCRAFDASLISDYPEECEWLIGFVYLRVLEVKTRPIVNDVKNVTLWENAPFASKIRVVFFAIHLFREQMFSMSEHLEYYLIEFLKCTFMQCCDEERWKKIDPSKRKTSFLSWLCKHVAKHPGALTNDEDWKERTEKDPDDEKLRRDIHTILFSKFNFFRETPNLKQIIKIDQISDGLKPFFLKKCDNDDVKGNIKYMVSFENLLRIFPNVEEVHYINNYRFDNNILETLINILEKRRDNINKQTQENESRDILSNEEKEERSIQREKRIKADIQLLQPSELTEQVSQTSLSRVTSHRSDNSGFDDVSDEEIDDDKVAIPRNKSEWPYIHKIVFLYYNYSDAKDSYGKSLGYPATGDKFFHPKDLKTELRERLKQLKWRIIYGKNGKTGYKIRLFDNAHAKSITEWLRRQNSTQEIKY